MDPIIVDTPDGGTAEFPAGTPHDVIKGALAKRFPKPAAAPAERGIAQRAGDFMRDQAGWQATRALNAGTGMAGQNPIVEPVKRIVEGADVDFKADAKTGGYAAPISTQALAWASPVVSRIMKYVYPDAQTQRDVAHGATGTQPVNLPGTAGKIVDTGVEAAIGARAFPGGARNVVAGFGAGAGSEGLGNVPGIKGTRWEPAARLVGAGLGGTVGAAGTEVAMATGRGLRNTAGANNVDQTASRIINRGFDRDKVAPPEVRSRIESLGDDAMPYEAGGQNVKGVLRGAIAAPGEARTTVHNRFDARTAKEPGAVADTINKNVSPKGLTGAVDELVQARSDAAKPKYIAAGVPDDPALYGQAPVLQGQAVRDLIANSADVRRAIAAARRLPDYKDLPDTSMVLLDKAYKHIGDMETAARVAGKGTRARDMESLRTSLAKAIDDENPAYGEALAAFSGPSKLIDAANLGKRAFASNMPPEAVARDFGRLRTPDAQDAYLTGIAEHLRTKAGGKSASGVAGRLITPQDEARLKAALPPERFEAIIGNLNTWRGRIQGQRDVEQGSRTVPMGLEAADTAGQVAGAAATQLARGNPVSAVMTALSGLTGRVAQGTNERVNARIAEMLTNGSPEARRALIDALEKSLLDQRIASPRNTFGAGAVSGVPTIGPIVQPRDDRRDRPR